MDTETLPIRGKTGLLALIGTEKFCSVRGSAKRTDSKPHGGKARVHTARRGKNGQCSGGRPSDPAGKRAEDTGVSLEREHCGGRDEKKTWKDGGRGWPWRKGTLEPQRDVAVHASERLNAGGKRWRDAETPDHPPPAAGAAVARPLWETVWQFLKTHTRNHQTPSDCPPGRLSPRTETQAHTRTCPRKFTAALSRPRTRNNGGVLTGVADLTGE